MKILVVGAGGREHALAACFARDSEVETVICAPGNAGTGAVARNAAVAVSDIDGLLGLAEREAVDLTVVGPELPLDRGIVDRFEAAGRPILGPSRAAAQLECSKVFAKQFMARHGIPTARFRACGTAAEAYRALDESGLGFPVVVKADGLAAGKGVVVAPDRASAAAAIRDAMEEGRFGAAGARVVIEECLRGPEASFFALCDGERAVPLRSAQDHKRAYDGDAGPNTGGMGAFSPSPLLDSGLEAAVMDTIVRPVLRGLAREGIPYRGFLYAGLMLTCTGPQVIEFNVRFGDPEAQVVLPAVAEPLAPRLLDAARGSLEERPIAFADERFVGVVLASEGYPASGPVGREITGLDAAGRLPGVTVFHSGSALRDDAVVTAGGRVLTVVGRGTSFEQAIGRAYAGVSAIHFDGMHFRRDIGAATRGPQTV